MLKTSRFVGSSIPTKGTTGWVRHRFSLIILAPLTVWALFFMIPEMGGFFCRSYHFSIDVYQWLKTPYHGFFLVIWLSCLLYHGTLSIQTMIEDYIRPLWCKMGCILLLKATSWAFLALGLMSIYRLWTS